MTGTSMHEYFFYYGQEGKDILEDVICIRIHSSIKAIKDLAFHEHRQLVVAILNEGLEVIGREAFAWCRLLESIIIPNAIKATWLGNFFPISLTSPIGSEIQILVRIPKIPVRKTFEIFANGRNTGKFRT